MTLADQVLEYVTRHPYCTSSRIHEDIRKPHQEVEHALGFLKRTRRIYQPFPGQWLLRPAMVDLSGGKALMSAGVKTTEKFPEGMKRCPTCKELKARADFKESAYCRPCRLAYQSNYHRRRKSA